MAPRLPRHRIPRSTSKDRSLGRRRHNTAKSGRSPRTCIIVLAFIAGATLTVIAWSRLQAYGFPGPWAQPRASESLRALRSRRNFLLQQLEIANSMLASRNENAGASIGVSDSFGQGLKGDPVSASYGVHGALSAGAGDLLPVGMSGGAGVGSGEAGAGTGIKVQGHFILGLSQEAFRSTPVDEMMSHYDTKKCDSSFGNGLIDQWRQTGTNCCEANRGTAESSSIRCHLIHQDDHHGDGDNLVHMSNVQVDLSGLADVGVASRVMQKYKESKHNDQAYVRPSPGAVKGTCTTDSETWRQNLFPGWNADWTTAAFQSVGELQCDEWVDHSVLVVQRDTFANLFHDSEDFVNAFLAMAILRKQPGHTQVFLTDLYPQGPFWPMWDKVFGSGWPTMTSWDIGKRYGDTKVCFRDLTIGIYGPAAPTTLARLVTPCFHTAIVRSYSDFVIRGLGLQGRTRYAFPPSKKVVVTWVARRSSVQWPERAYCSEDGKESFFTCDYFKDLDIRPLQRRVQNEDKVVASLRALEQYSFLNGAEVEVRDVDYNLLTFEDQIKNDLETDVMIGPHGAGLFHIIFTPDRAVLIELQIEGTTGRKHFNNLANWSGHGYRSRGGPNSVDMVAAAISDMDLSKH